MEAAFKKQPEAMRLLAAQGLSSREYWLCMMALMQAALVEGFSQGKADLKALPPGVNPDNLRFIRENKAELEKLQSEMARAASRLPRSGPPRGSGPPRASAAPPHLPHVRNSPSTPA